MGKREITYKLDTFLKLHQPLSEECHAVYLMAEIRKLLDRSEIKNANYSLLRFYCDWTLHTQKERHLEHIAPIIGKMYLDVERQLQHLPVGVENTSDIVDFMYFKSLREEMQRFFEYSSIETTLTKNDECWILYISLMVNILVDQPIISPTPKVSVFAFHPAAARCVKGVLELTGTIRGGDGTDYNSYTFINAY